MIHWLSTAFDTYVVHPLHGAGYLWWSGVGSDIGEVSILAALATWATHHNCETKGCWRLGHADPQHGQPVCRRHLKPRDGEPVGLTTSDGEW